MRRYHCVLNGVAIALSARTAQALEQALADVIAYHQTGRAHE